MDELVEYYKNKYEETLAKLNESEKNVKILKERIETLLCACDCDFSVSKNEDDDEEDEDDSENDSENDSDEDEDGYEKEENNNIEEKEDNDFSEEEIKKIKEKMVSFNKNKQLLPVYTVEEVEECEKRIGFNLPIAFKNYITKVSREFIYNIFCFRIVINLDSINHTTVSIYLNGESCSDHHKIYIQGNKKNKVACWTQNDYCREYSRICANNFKKFVFQTLRITG